MNLLSGQKLIIARIFLALALFSVAVAKVDRFYASLEKAKRGPQALVSTNPPVKFPTNIIAKALQ
ncbi:MAG: hypothetical protein JWO73_9 [Candidatus Taylorbacteria bacterium]|nr:hypothetical protein [Candidatus Taylorbacteria bacterium]